MRKTIATALITISSITIAEETNTHTFKSPPNKEEYKGTIETKETEEQINFTFSTKNGEIINVCEKEEEKTKCLLAARLTFAQRCLSNKEEIFCKAAQRNYRQWIIYK